ncbi:unnamed protein product [Closterium sp. Naga37s-1]|nr:unnamed protein product [Closterium sp. Naga37s-1]
MSPLCDCCGLCSRRQNKNHRWFYVNEPAKNGSFGFSNNKIRTAKYRWYSFIPKALFEQFCRVANIYFLFHALVSLTPASPVSPLTTIAPLSFVVGLAMLKELFEDVKRGRSDTEINHRRVMVIRPDGSEEACVWQALRVGDLVKVHRDGFFPADLICLATSGDRGACSVDTMGLDGETNLKTRNAISETNAMSLAELAGLRGRVECEHPSAAIYTFVGKMRLGVDADSYDEEKEAEETATGNPPLFLGPENILLRGSQLRNTGWAVGMVVYTGRQTKIMMNSTDPPYKRSFVERRLDYVIIFEVVLLLTLAAGSAVVFALALARLMPAQWYLRPHDYSGLSGIAYVQFDWTEPEYAAITQFFTGLVLYGYFVPISLYVTVELVKLTQAALMARDARMFFHDRQVPAAARTSNLNEELGMVQAILSDKTGTLTRIQMDFFKCSIAGISYGIGHTEVERAAAARAVAASAAKRRSRTRTRGTSAGKQQQQQRGVYGDEDDEDDEEAEEDEGANEGDEEDAQYMREYVPTKPLEKGFNMRDPRLDDLNWRYQSSAGDIRRFLEVLAVCHTVMADKGDGRRAGDAGEAEGGMGGGRGGDADAELGALGPVPSDASVPNVRFLAESPDEAALLVAAKRMGLVFTGREGRDVCVNEYAKHWKLVAQHKYSVLNTFKFTSHRKRMSVIVRTPLCRLVLMTKGADSVIMDRLAPTPYAQRYRAATQRQMNQYAEAGLRTLALAWRDVDDREYAEWQARWEEAQGFVGDAGVQAGKLDALADEMERGLELLGATAIEDKLQVGVPQTIESLARAGIRLWVMTGDKLETAVNIGFACRLLRHGMQQHVLFLEDNDAMLAAADKAAMDPDEYAFKSIQEQLVQAKQASSQLRAHGIAPIPSFSPPAPSLYATSSNYDSDSNDDTSAEGGADRKPPDHPLTAIPPQQAIILDGKALSLILTQPALAHDFLEVAAGCATVICCRMSPGQKAVIAGLVREQMGLITLAIGDGANDVGMIQRANIGVGIVGEEGLQAAMAADFSLGQFRFLERLVLVHGAWNYVRLTGMIKYFLYKCHTFAFTIFFYNALTLFSGTPVYYDWLLVLYPLVFSSLPVAVLGSFDQDVKDTYRLRYPQLYTLGQRNSNFTWRSLLLWMLKGDLQALTLVLVCFLPFLLSAAGADGRSMDLSAQGTLLFTALVVTVNLEMATTLQGAADVHVPLPSPTHLPLTRILSSLFPSPLPAPLSTYPYRAVLDDNTPRGHMGLHRALVRVHLASEPPAARVVRLLPRGGGRAAAAPLLLPHRAARHRLRAPALLRRARHCTVRSPSPQLSVGSPPLHACCSPNGCLARAAQPARINDSLLRFPAPTLPPLLPFPPLPPFPPFPHFPLGLFLPSAARSPRPARHVAPTDVQMVQEIERRDRWRWLRGSASGRYSASVSFAARA